MDNNQSSYRQILKATSIFGGVQVFNILISIIRSKFVAVLLGPSGMGIIGLLNSATSLINGLTSFGLGTSAVKDVAAANSNGNQARISSVVLAFKRWVLITGLFGTLVTLVLSPYLSQITFGNKDYTAAFAWIAITLLFVQLTSGQNVILQGMQKLKYLAQANLGGSVLGLLIAVPLYFFFRIDAIVPVIILSSLMSLAISWFFARKIKLVKIHLSWKNTVLEGKSMLMMGFMIGLSGLIGSATAYIVRIFISRQGGVHDVGLYTAGFAIINTYVGLVFNAMATDYYPRLSAVAHSNELSKTTINQQAEVALLILAPLIIIFTIFIHSVIVILYSDKFLEIDTMILWAALGMFFRATSWSLGFLLLAKGASRLYLINAILFEGYFLLFNIFGYKYVGLTGLGLSYAIGYFASTVQMAVVCSNQYSVKFSRKLFQIFTIQFILAFTSLIAVMTLKTPYTYFAGIILIVISTWYSVSELNKRLDLKAIISGLKKKYPFKK